MKRIEIIIDVQGKTHIETKGFAGIECFEASKFIERALGKSVETQTTTEFFKTKANQNQQAKNGN